MPILSNELRLRLSGGANNSDPNQALGGAVSSVDAPATLFDNVTSNEASAGDTEYRCIYVRNNNPTLTLLGGVLWVSVNTPSASTDIAVGLGTSAISGTEQVVANEGTAPVGVTFSNASNKAGGVALGDLPPGATRAVWVRRTVGAGAASVQDTYTIRVEGDSLP